MLDETAVGYHRHNLAAGDCDRTHSSRAQDVNRTKVHSHLRNAWEMYYHVLLKRTTAGHYLSLVATVYNAWIRCGKSSDCYTN